MENKKKLLWFIGILTVLIILISLLLQRRPVPMDESDIPPTGSQQRELNEYLGYDLSELEGGDDPPRTQASSQEELGKLAEDPVTAGREMKGQKSPLRDLEKAFLQDIDSRIALFKRQLKAYQEQGRQANFDDLQRIQSEIGKLETAIEDIRKVHSH